MGSIKDSVTAIILASLGDAWSEFDHKEKPSLDSDIFGGESILDSTGLVSFVLDIEERLEEDLGLTISLLDEKAVSQKHSPFQNVSTMVDFVLRSIEETKGD